MTEAEALRICIANHLLALVDAIDQARALYGQSTTEPCTCLENDQNCPYCGTFSEGDAILDGITREIVACFS